MMNRSRFHIAAMDCPSEEQLIRSAFGSLSEVERMEFDIPARSLMVWHRQEAGPILQCLKRLDLGAELAVTEQVPESEAKAGGSQDQTRVLRLLLAINAIMFVAELSAGLIAESTGLLSDSLDMLADAMVYGMALCAVGRASESQRMTAKLSGWLEMLLACGVLFEVGRSALFGSEPDAPIMMGMAALALVANSTCVWALARHRHDGPHMRASWIFSTNDVIANLGVIVAGALVSITSSAIPDLVVGLLIGLIVMRGALRILRLGKAS